MRQEILIALVSILIVFAFTFWFLKLTIDDRSSSLSNTVTVCPAGLCSTNKLSGEKTCPSTPEGQADFNLVIDACNSRYVCDAKQTPFAVRPDGGTLPLTDPEASVCPENSVCQCTEFPQCPVWVAGYFERALGGKAFYQEIQYSLSGSSPLDARPLSISREATCFVTQRLVENGSIWPSECIRGRLAAIVERLGDPLADAPYGCVLADNQSDFSGVPLSTPLVFDLESQMLHLP